MKLWRRITTIVVLLFSLSVTEAQTTNDAFNSFWKTFKAAIAKNDKEAVANFTKLPFLYDSRERDRAGFIKIYDQLFTRKVRRCVATAKLVKEQENYEIFCGELIFYFGKDSDGTYKLLEFGAND
jgi:hypothetical protein